MSPKANALHRAMFEKLMVSILKQENMVWAVC